MCTLSVQMVNMETRAYEKFMHPELLTAVRNSQLIAANELRGAAPVIVNGCTATMVSGCQNIISADDTILPDEY